MFLIQIRSLIELEQKDKNLVTTYSNPFPIFRVSFIPVLLNNPDTLVYYYYIVFVGLGFIKTRTLSTEEAN